MFKNHIDIKLKHKKFIKEVCETEIVFALKSKNGFATSYSNEFEDEDGEPIGIICFWSKEIMAKICAKNEWDDYHPAKQLIYLIFLRIGVLACITMDCWLEQTLINTFLAMKVRAII
ncbi:DUF2750 domain-containing protein [Flavobacterium ginsengisoli]|uniref:DUF2750 domain-containing protein n=1 Tax=Flavobacterium ginsengisoli TaxID=871694 RepID=UPI0024156282|nr:DUF2750 domain-containing protein [Flavobacterium ginsengisoli]